MRCEAGDRVLLLGANASGKSTLLNILAGSLRPERGYVERTSGRIGLFSPDLYLYPHLPVREHLYLWSGIVGQAKSFSGLAQKFGLTALLDLPVRELSWGQRVRLSLCRALGSDAEILLLDEPTTGLDDHGAAVVLDLLRTYSRACQIVASHDLSRFTEWATRMILLERGRIVLECSCAETTLREELISRYRAVNQ